VPVDCELGREVGIKLLQVDFEKLAAETILGYGEINLKYFRKRGIFK